MSTNTDLKRRQWFWFIGLWLIGPLCLAILDGFIKLLFSFL